MIKSPMVESAVRVLELEGKELTFNELYEKVIIEMNTDKEVATKKIAKLYSDITLDKRIISLPDNKWDLKKRRKFDETIVDTSDIIVEDDEYQEDIEIANEDLSEAEDTELVDFEDDIELIDEEDEEDIIDNILKKEYDEDIEEIKEIAITIED